MINSKNSVFIATSLDGYIADKNGDLKWLHAIPNPEKTDMGYAHFMEGIDALVMGRHTFETVCGFDVEWPYSKPVFVLSNTMNEVPNAYKEKAFLVNGNLNEVLDKLHQMQFLRLYIDGGRTINNFLKADLIDELIITTIPILLGGGIPLFRELHEELNFELVSTGTFLNQIVQSHYRRKK